MNNQLAYRAVCIECGEVFSCTFRTAETNKDKLYDIGMEMASGWGAECISVESLVPTEPLSEYYDADEHENQISGVM